MQPSAGAPAHFEAIERRERLMNRKSNSNRGWTEWLACSCNAIEEPSHSFSGSEAITLHRPYGIFEIHHCRVQSLEFDPNQSNVPTRIRIEMALKFDNLPGKTIDKRHGRRVKSRDLK
jgi:hypothetical protein